MRDEIGIILSRDLELTIFSHYERWNPKHLPIRVGVSKIFAKDVGYIYSREFEATAFTREIWSPLHIFMRDGVNSILS